MDKDIILGEWNLTEFSYSGINSVKDGDETASVSYSAEAKDLNAQVVFQDAGKYTTAGSYTLTLTTTVDGETSAQDFPYPDITGSGTYRIEGNKMITTPNAGDELIIQASEGIIEELTPNRMVLVIEERSVTKIDEMEVEINFDMIQVLTR
ncbi:lipocalin family protein [Salinimicrobium flavum]|uniref:Lipocalin family protein n=1 Tax=Salinimicrobium flavum TaxID=1737065 RepID=A0ABW5IUT6_9FLAO